jgi:hypothetical protein
MTKVELLLEKGRRDCEYVRELYHERNLIGHGNAWTKSFVIAAVAQRMESIVAAFVTT